MPAIFLNVPIAKNFIKSFDNLVSYLNGTDTAPGILTRLNGFLMSVALDELYHSLMRMRSSVERSLVEKTGSSDKRLHATTEAMDVVRMMLATEVVSFVRGSASEFRARITCIESNAPQTFAVWGTRLKRELALFNEAQGVKTLYPDSAVRSFTVMNNLITDIEERAKPEKLVAAAAVVESAMKPVPARPKPDNKRGKRLADQELRTQMKGKSGSKPARSAQSGKGKKGGQAAAR